MAGFENIYFKFPRMNVTSAYMLQYKMHQHFEKFAGLQ